MTAKGLVTQLRFDRSTPSASRPKSSRKAWPGAFVRHDWKVLTLLCPHWEHVKHDEAYRNFLYGSDALSAVGSEVHKFGWSGLSTLGTANANLLHGTLHALATSLSLQAPLQFKFNMTFQRNSRGQFVGACSGLSIRHPTPNTSIFVESIGSVKGSFRQFRSH